MQPSMLSAVLGSVALALFCLGLPLGIAMPSRRTGSDAMVHAGVMLLAGACAISDGEVYSRAAQLLTIRRARDVRADKNARGIGAGEIRATRGGENDARGEDASRLGASRRNLHVTGWVTTFA